MTSIVRLGFLVPPGNPHVEPELVRLAPPGVTVHFDRLVARAGTGTHEGQEERNRSHIAHIDENVELMALVRPSVICLGHTATSYTLGREGEAELKARLEKKSGIPFITAFGSVIEALRHLGVERVALGAPYSAQDTLKSKGHLEANGLKVVHWGGLDNVKNIYDETEARAALLARKVNHAEAQAVFLSGVGLPTIGILEAAEMELGKPVLSSTVAMMWNALRVAGVKTRVKGFGQLLAG